MRLSGGGSPSRIKPLPGTDPPRWLLALGVAAVGLLLAGVVVGGEIGRWLAWLACTAMPTLAGAFLGLLALRYWRQRSRE